MKIGPHPQSIWNRALVGFLVIWTYCCVASASPKRILILDSFGRDVAPFNAAASAFRTALAKEMGEPMDIYEASLDKARFAEPEKESPFLEFLRSRFESRQLDLVVPIGAPAVKFVAQHRDHLFPNSPIVYTGADPRMLPPGLLQSNATLVTQRVNLTGIIEDILQMRPDTTNVVVVFGASPLEKFWVGECHREFQSFTNRMGFTWFDNLSLDQMCKRSAALPPHSFILFGMFVLDAALVPYDNDDALDRLHAAANAPIFAYFESEFGRGPIGGRLYHDSEVGVRAAQAGIRILHGEQAQSIPPLILEGGPNVYDWRELHRWGIDETRFPAGSKVRFRVPTIWEQYRWQITGGITLCAIEMALIVGLVLQLRRRRQAENRSRLAEEEARQLSGRLITAYEEERSRLARELHDDVTQRLARLTIDLGLAGQPGAGGASVDVQKGVREELVRLSDDIHALSHQLHPSILEHLGLGEAILAEVEQFSRRENLPMKLELGEVPPELPSAISLGLYRITQEALRNIGRHAQASRVEITLRATDTELLLTIRDDGIGFDTSRSPVRPGLGLASMRERAHLFGGQIHFDSRPGHGTSIDVKVPLPRIAA